MVAPAAFGVDAVGPGLVATGIGGFTTGFATPTAGFPATGGGFGFDATGGTGLLADPAADSAAALFFFHGGAVDEPFGAIPGNTATGFADGFAITGVTGAFVTAGRGGGGGAAGSALGGMSSR